MSTTVGGVQTHKVAAVVVTYNRLSLLQECLTALEQQELPEGSSLDIFVVDNASTDGTGAWLAKESGVSKDDSAQEQGRTMLHVISLPQNTGGAGGFYEGIRQSVSEGYDLIWLMDDDTIPTPSALFNLMKAGEQKQWQVGFLCSAVVWTNGEGARMNQPFVSQDYGLEVGSLKEGLLKVDKASFVSILIPAEVIRLVGLPIKEYFIWNDDIEYTGRITRQLGRSSYLVGSSIALHKTANNAGSDIATDSLERLSRYRLAFRNERNTARQGSGEEKRHYRSICFWTIWKILKVSKDHKAKRILTVLQGRWEGLFFRPKAENPFE